MLCASRILADFTLCPSLKPARGCHLCCLTKPCRRNVPDERPLQPRNASHGGTSLTPRVPAAPCSGVADLVFVRLIIIIINYLVIFQGVHRFLAAVAVSEAVGQSILAVD